MLGGCYVRCVYTYFLLTCRKERTEFIRLKYVEHLFVHPHKSRSPSAVPAPHTPTPYDQTSGESDCEVEQREPTPTPSISSVTSVPANFHFPSHSRSRSQTLDMHSRPKLDMHSLKKSVVKYAKKKNPFRHKPQEQSNHVVESDEDDTFSNSVSGLSCEQEGSSSSGKTSSRRSLKSWGLTASLSSLRISNFSHKSKSHLQGPPTPELPRGPPPDPPPKPPRTKKRIKAMEKDPLNDEETSEPLLASHDSSMDFEFKDFLEEFDRRLGDRSVSVGDLTRMNQSSLETSTPDVIKVKKKASSTHVVRTGSFPSSPKTAISTRGSKSVSSSPVCIKKTGTAPILSDLLSKTSPPLYRISVTSSTPPSVERTKGPLKATPDSSPQLRGGVSHHGGIRAARKLSDIDSDSSSSHEDLAHISVEESDDLGRISVGDVSIGELSTDGHPKPNGIHDNSPNSKQVETSDSFVKEVIGSPTHSEISNEDRPLPDEPVTMPYDASPDLVCVLVYVCWWCVCLCMCWWCVCVCVLVVCVCVCVCWWCVCVCVCVGGVLVYVLVVCMCVCVCVLVVCVLVYVLVVCVCVYVLVVCVLVYVLVVCVCVYVLVVCMCVCVCWWCVCLCMCWWCVCLCMCWWCVC